MDLCNWCFLHGREDGGITRTRTCWVNVGQFWGTWSIWVSIPLVVSITWCLDPFYKLIFRYIYIYYDVQVIYICAYAYPMWLIQDWYPTISLLYSCKPILVTGFVGTLYGFYYQWKWLLSKTCCYPGISDFAFSQSDIRYFVSFKIRWTSNPG